MLRLVFSVGLLVLLFTRLPELDLDDLVPDITVSTFAWIGLAIAVHVIAYVLQALRWAEVSDTLDIHLPFKRLFNHLLAGEFVSNALPTSVGGDVVRVMRQGRETGDFADSFASTSLERLTGWLVLPVISMFAMVVHPEFFSLGGATTAAILINVVTLVSLLALLWLAGHPRGAGRLVGRTGWRRYLGAVHLGIVAFRHRPLRVTRVIVAGVGFQLLQCVCVWACARALQIPEVTILAAMAFFPPPPSPRTCRSPSEASGSVRRCSSCSSVRSAHPTPRRSAWACSSISSSSAPASPAPRASRSAPAGESTRSRFRPPRADDPSNPAVG